jgi:hypothetical protein
MILNTDDLGDVQDVSAPTMHELLAADSFGEFAILSASDDEYIQACSAWDPGPECAAFRQGHDGSDPWVLEHREGGQQFQAGGHLALEQVIQAFQSYLAGGPEWRASFDWRELEL